MHLPTAPLSICHVSARSDLMHVNFCSLNSSNLLPRFPFWSLPLILNLFQVNPFLPDWPYISPRPAASEEDLQSEVQFKHTRQGADMLSLHYAMKKWIAQSEELIPDPPLIGDLTFPLSAGCLCLLPARCLTDINRLLL